MADPKPTPNAAPSAEPEAGPAPVPPASVDRTDTVRPAFPNTPRRAGNDGEAGAGRSQTAQPAAQPTGQPAGQPAAARAPGPQAQNTPGPVVRPAQPRGDGDAPRRPGQPGGPLRPAQPGQPNPNAPPRAPGAPGGPGGPAKPRPPAPAPVAHVPVAPPASRARLGRRHIGVLLTFVLLVLLPSLVAAWYLYQRAADQYASYLGFSVRSESAPAATELLGGLGALTGLGSSSTSDTDILYKFIQSHQLVSRIDEELDLRAIWSRPDDDPIFAYGGGATLEDLMSEWDDKIRVYYDNGMIDLRILAFDPRDAQAIGQALLRESSAMINAINDVAREDVVRYSREELDTAVERLKEARQAMTTFRNAHQIVDPTADVQGQAGVLASLQQQLAESLIQLGVLESNAQQNDPRIAQTQLRVDVIRQQIDKERLKFGSETAEGEQLSELVGEYEGLVVDREFAETAYTAARAAYDAALAEAQRQSRYLAAYVEPTLADRPEYPQREKLLAILAGFLLLIWIIGVLTFYSLRDRR